jgi:acyltransferase
MINGGGFGLRSTYGNRSAAIDAVRVLGILAVIVGHVWTDNIVVRAAVFSWHVPLFFFLTGYFWSPLRSIGDEWRKRFASLGRPYITWLVLITLLFLPWAYLREDGLSLLTAVSPFLGGTYIGRPYSAFWFMGALFAVALLYRLMQRVPLPAQWAIAIAALATGYLFPDALAAVPLGVGIALPSLIFVVAGYTLKAFRAAIGKPVMFGCTLLLLITILLATGMSRPMDLKQLDLGIPAVSILVAIAISVGMVVVSESVVPKLGYRLGRLMVNLAQGGTLVILTHAAVLWVLGTPPDGAWLDFSLALILPWTAALVLQRTALAPYLLGGTRTARMPIADESVVVTRT